METKQFKEHLTNLYSKTQKNTPSKLFYGVTLGFHLYILVVLVTLGIEAIIGTNEWTGTFFQDIRALAIVAGVLLAFEVWGLIPHPKVDSNKD